jgi:hypothetical protein
MMRKTISQTEARRLQKRVAQLEALVAGERRRYGGEYHGGTHVATLNSVGDYLLGTIKTARALGHAVMVTADGTQVFFYALPHPKVPV